MKIRLNGEPRSLEEGATLASLVPRAEGCAVALNDAVVPASSWSRTLLAEDDAVEIVTAHQGG